MTDIPVPISSQPGVKVQEGAGRLINCFAVKNEQGARFPVSWYRSAGLRQVLSIASHSHLRGGILVGSTLIIAMDARAYTVTVSGSTFSSTNEGALAGDEPITVAKNNAATPNIVAVTENGALNLFTSGAPTAFADADLPQPNSVSELNGYFLWTIGDGRIFASDLNAVTVSSSAFTTEQSFGGLRRGVTFNGEFYAFGATGFGVYKDIGSSPFPLSRQFAVETGLAGTHAIAGWEPGWINQLIWVSDDNTVKRLNGYTPETISNDDVTRDIQAAVLAGDGALLEANVYMQGQHAFWALTYPGNWTHEYNATTGNWNERESFNRDDCRASCAIRAFNRWIRGDRLNGKLYQVDESYYREGDDALNFDIYTGAVANFPARIAIPRADFDFTSAVGVASGEDPVQTDPSVLIRWSLDGGYSYGNFVTRKLGAQGESGQSVTVQRIGMTKGKGARFHVRISDPVHIGFQGGQVPAEIRAAA
jgi:hypothetical protein